MDNSHDSNKPVAWINTTGDFLFQHPEEHGRENEEWFPLVHQNTSPPASKPWVNLTEQEHTDIAIQCGCMSADWLFYGATVERILKEKNS